MVQPHWVRRVPFLPLPPKRGPVLQELVPEATAIDNRQGYTMEGRVAQPEVECCRWELAPASSALCSLQERALPRSWESCLECSEHPMLLASVGVISRKPSRFVTLFQEEATDQAQAPTLLRRSIREHSTSRVLLSFELPVPIDVWAGLGTSCQHGRLAGDIECPD